MIDNFLKNDGQKTPFNSFFKSFKTKLAALFILLLITSCKDQGCIEADDFGEYEYEVVTVKASGAAQSCVYDYSLAIDDPAQGSGLTNLTSGTVNITVDELNPATGLIEPKDYTSTAGCSFFADGTNTRTICILDVIQKCQLFNQATGQDADPGWSSTSERDSSQNAGITLYPDSEIEITAVGMVSLGDHIEYDSHFISPTSMFPASHPDNWRSSTGWNPQFFDVKVGQVLNAKFSGLWSNGSGPSSKSIGGGNTGISGVSTNDEPIYNAARRTVVYLRPFPVGYEFDNTQTTEVAGNLGTPLVPRPNLWTCDYATNPATLAEPVCDSGDYRSIYTDATKFSADDNILTREVYPVTAAEKSSVLELHGGMIRWKNDGIHDNSYDPFASSVPTSMIEGGMTLGDISSGKTITNNQGVSYQVSFRSTDSNCDVPLTVKVQEGAVVLDSYNSRPYSADNIDLSDPNPGASTQSTSSDPEDVWSQYDLALEPGQDLVIAANTDLNAGGANCGESIQVRFIQYHEITLAQSGLVSFTMLNSSSTQTCNISGSIINPAGSHSDDTTNSMESDFYEYDPLIPAHHLHSLSVPSSNASGYTWSTPIFVRKGQKIRFNPDSWYEDWTTQSGVTHCGIGMAMKIEARPALLCRGNKTDKVDNPLCVPEYKDGVLIGCVADDPVCYDDASTTTYCPTACQATITCTADGVSPDYKKSTCTAGALPPEDGVDCIYSASSPTLSATTCGTVSGCAAKMVENANKAAKIDQQTDQCYNLEDYKGKIDNIKNGANLGFTDAQLSDANIAKGAKLLGNFNGSFGNLEGFTTTTNKHTSDNDNWIYQVRAPLIFSKSGRLQFLLLDGDDFENINSAYNDNTIATNNYSGSNGIRIDLSGALEFFNGEMMSARLCTVESNGVCKGQSNPIAITPTITEYNPSSSTQASGEYSFLQSGTLARKTAADTSFDCGHSATYDNLITTSTTSSFYCHIGEPTDIKDYRLTFKIIDPETPNCDLTDPVSGTNNDGIQEENPYYDSTNSANTGAICDIGEEPLNPPVSGTVCEKQFYCADKYINNTGEYKVTIKVKKPDGSNISNVIGGVVNPIIAVLDGPKDGSAPSQAERVYSLLIADYKYQLLLSVALGVMVTFYGLGTLMGVSELTHSELLTRLLKIGIIYLFVSPDGWAYFNEFFVAFFKDGTDYLAFMMASSFDNSESISSAIADGDYYDKSILFESVDAVFGMFFSDAVQKKISALLFADIFGVVYLWIIYLSFMLYVYAVCNAVLLYLTAQIFITILFILGPLFFIFLLFGQTKDMFDNWLKQLISFSLQQIFLLTTLAFFNMMMYEVIKMSLGYKICWDVVWTIKVFGPVIELLSFWTIPSEAPSSGGTLGDPSGDAPSLFTILFIWVVASLMNKFIGFMTDVAASISGGIKASELGSGIRQAAQAVQKTASKGAESLYKGSVGRQVERLDMQLFDSGAQAKKARKARREQHSQDSGRTGVLRNAGKEAGNQAEADYKKNNAHELAKMTRTEQKQKLQEVKQAAKKDAIAAKGKSMGLSEKEIERLTNKKGSTYEGHTAYGFVGHSIGQLGSSGGTLFRSVNDEDKKSKSTLKRSDVKESLKNATKEERAQIEEGLESGNLKVERSALGKVKKAAGSVRNSYKRGTMTSDAKNTAKDAANATGSAMASPFKAISKSAKNAVGAGKFGDSKKQLIAEGKVSDSLISSEDETKLIEERMKENSTTTRTKDGKVMDMKAYRKAEKQLMAEGKTDYKSFEERQDNTADMEMIEQRMKENDKTKTKIDSKSVASLKRKADKYNKKEAVLEAREQAAQEGLSEEEQATADRNLQEANEQYKKYSKKGTENPLTPRASRRRAQKKADKSKYRKEALEKDYNERKEEHMKNSGVQEAYEKEETSSIESTEARTTREGEIREEAKKSNKTARDQIKKDIKKSKSPQEKAKLNRELKKLRSQKSSAKEVERFAQFEQSKDAAQSQYEESKGMISALENKVKYPKEGSDPEDIKQAEKELQTHKKIVSTYEKIQKDLKTATKGKRLESSTDNFKKVNEIRENSNLEETFSDRVKRAVKSPFKGKQHYSREEESVKSPFERDEDK